MGAAIALCHHEHWDGGGYPHGLAGETIPIGARICAIVDFYDASTMHRPHRRALPIEQVLASMKDDSERRFDPALLAAFFTCIREIEGIREDYPVEVEQDFQLAAQSA